MSLNNSIYVVSRSQGEYSDRTETPIVAFTEKLSAERFVEEASAQARDAELRFPIDYITYDDVAALKGRASIQTLDPDGVDAYEYPYYFFCEIPLFTSLAQGIEAQRATTTEIGVVGDESPVAESDAPNPCSPSDEDQGQ